MGYENSKIYKLQCDDGYYYIGSTINELRVRLGQHKQDCKRYEKRKVYEYINELGWDKVKIVLMEAFSCNNRAELRMKEDEHICNHRDDPMCLNIHRAFLTEEERKQYEKEHREKYYAENRNHYLELGKEWYKKNIVQKKINDKKRYEKNKIKATLDTLQSGLTH